MAVQVDDAGGVVSPLQDFLVRPYRINARSSHRKRFYPFSHPNSRIDVPMDQQHIARDCRRV
jgi:hypothetical protein